MVEAQTTSSKLCLMSQHSCKLQDAEDFLIYVSIFPFEIKSQAHENASAVLFSLLVTRYTTDLSSYSVLCC